MQADSPSPMPEHDTRPVGWLVVISGPMLGQSFTLIRGTNTIGRRQNNFICLPDDEYISRAHLLINYKPESRSFYAAKAIETSQPTRLSDGRELSTELTPLESGEILRLSPLTSLRFVPFSNKFFDWKFSN